ncbi:MAG: GNAT family N-acetyltransferase [Planctomycetota bacterium]|jgi:putative acetyltransferase
MYKTRHLGETVRFRDYLPGDEERIFHLVKIVLAVHGLRADRDDKDRDLNDIAKSYLEAGGTFRIVESKRGNIVGCYGLYPKSRTTVELRKMYLNDYYHGHSIGNRMMEEALETARDLGFKEMVLETNSALPVATKLYEKFGFQPCPPEQLSDRVDGAMRLDLWMHCRGAR